MEGLETRLRLEVCFGGHGEDLVGIFVTAAATAAVTAAVTAVVAFAAATATATATVAVPWAVSAISYKNDTPDDVPV